jgi:DNA-binding SARP family transcriptional activator
MTTPEENQARLAQALTKEIHELLSKASSLSDEFAQRFGRIAAAHERAAMSAEERLKHDVEVFEYMELYFGPDGAKDESISNFREGLAEIFAERDAAIARAEKAEAELTAFKERAQAVVDRLEYVKEAHSAARQKAETALNDLMASLPVEPASEAEEED